MFSALVTTVRPWRRPSIRATSVVVVPPVRPIAIAVGDELGGGLRDPALLVAPAGAVTHRQLVCSAVRDRAAVRSFEQSLVAERLEIAADRGLADAELGRKHGDRDRAVAREQLEDAAESLGLAHARTLSSMQHA